ncbi:MAG: hypothetical protein EPO47_09985 [Rugosibacter sp.]|nr:MAG: hypothetical protein EPO60_09270 [Rugosibacter sp.]TBR07901.1 MAG: hypothetical protein EPO47_09985 [Rugosibacter sp.]
MKKNVYVILAGYLLMLMSAACSAVTPHENFVMSMQAAIGKSTDRIAWRRPEQLIGRKTLSNGNVEEFYKFRNSCFYYYEIDPRAHLIVGWRFEGTERDCEIAN